MNLERMYDLAYQFRQSKIWNVIYDEEVYGVRLADDLIGYCCVMGSLGECTALALFLGAEGFDNYRQLRNTPFDDEAENIYEMLIQDCVQCSLEDKAQLDEDEIAAVRAYAKSKGMALRGNNAYPQFLRSRPYCMPHPISDEAEWGYLATALEATVALAGYLKPHAKSKVGFTHLLRPGGQIPLLEMAEGALRIGRTPIPEPLPAAPAVPAPLDDMTVARLKRLKRDDDYECEIIRSPAPVMDETETFAFAPPMLLTVDQRMGTVRGFVTGTGPEIDPDELLGGFVDMLFKNGDYPWSIDVRSEAAAALLRDFCQRLNVKLTVKADLPHMDEAVASLNDNMEKGGVDEAEAEEQLIEFIDSLQDLSDAELRALPRFMKAQLMELAAHGVLPSDLVERLKR